MKPTPTGRLLRTATGSDLVLTRTLRAPIEDVWASVTDPGRTARWFGPWKGDAKPGNTIQVQMAYEEQAPWCDLRIDSCEPPSHLAVSMSDDAGTWRMEVRLSETGGSTELRFVQHLESDAGVGEIGPGWEYYLDMLLASREGAALPDFGEYYPAQKAYFEGLAGR
ncbi:SRPBCC family protein [Amycolatopsis anabasis]|uniref:SRPBCC family protein n=1 Tax=Amycolatopsis anabasis TaxID=1840409 RepID=UPI00131B3AFC|nr:SRPBCC family protein [Amycolatopsis anabasis]